MTAEEFARLALALPGAEEGSHFGQRDFRVNGKIFATLSLAREGFGVLSVTPELQEQLIDSAPEVYSPVPGGWGRLGSTRVDLKTVTVEEARRGLALSHQRRAAKPARRPRTRKPKK